MKNIATLGVHAESSQNEMSQYVLLRHLSSFQENDLEALMEDYTSDSVLITPNTSYTGLEEIKEYFADLISHFPKQKSIVKIDKTVINDDLVYIVWHAKTPSLEVSFATDTFIIKKDKILRQTFAGQLTSIG
ncbi:MAG: nuclear transport factor 2 family protein [Terrimonas sp.]|nr:nuclear transport factor 2 family protein [Terrimonas sp.]